MTKHGTRKEPGMGVGRARGAEDCFVVLSGDERERGSGNKQCRSYEISKTWLQCFVWLFSDLILIDLQ